MDISAGSLISEMRMLSDVLRAEIVQKNTELGPEKYADAWVVLPVVDFGRSLDSSPPKSVPF